MTTNNYNDVEVVTRLNTICSNNKLTVTAVFRELDFQGNVLTKKLVSDIPYTLDTSAFLDYSIKYGTLKGYKAPYTEGYSSLMKNYFSLTEHEDIWLPDYVETEVVCKLAKFVFMRKNENTVVMQWEDVNGE